MEVFLARIRQLLPVLGSELLTPIAQHGAKSEPSIALIKQGDFYTFTKDSEFSSPPVAASVIHGGGASGPKEWRRKDGVTLKEIDEGE